MNNDDYELTEETRFDDRFEWNGYTLTSLLTPEPEFCPAGRTMYAVVADGVVDEESWSYLPEDAVEIHLFMRELEANDSQLPPAKAGSL